VLGIFIRVASVIWLLAIGEGISAKAQEQIQSLGAENIIVRSVKPPAEVLGQSGISEYGLTRADWQKLANTVPTLRSSVPIREVRRQFTHGPNNLTGRLVGCTAEYADVNTLEMQSGIFITEEHQRKTDNVCVLASNVAEALFGYENPIGGNVTIDDDIYSVIGVVRPRAATAAIGGSLSGQEYDKDIYIPIKTLWQRMGDIVTTRESGSFQRELVELNQVTLRVESVDQVMPTADLVRDSLSHHDRMKDISIVVPAELLEQARQTKMMFMVFMGLIAAISLIVGGIGIMNIMLATVTERTREIGIGRAVVAQPDWIGAQLKDLDAIRLQGAPLSADTTS
jgi:putative ABC transport system permease protein